MNAQSTNQSFKWVAPLLLLATFSCKKNLLNQIPTTELSADLFWKSNDDATYAVNGVYEANRTVFGREYLWDGGGELVHVRRTAQGTGDFNQGNNTLGTMGSNFDYYWAACYTTVNRANFVLQNLQRLRGNLKTNDEMQVNNTLTAEVRFMRGMGYFRLIDLWGDVPYFSKPLEGNVEAYTLSRTPKAAIKDSILADLDYASTNLPETPYRGEKGRITRNAALGMSGKVRLFWACWMKNEGKTTEAQTYYAAAAADFKKIISKNVPLFRGGDPGPATKPNYGDLFQFTNEADPEILYSVTFAGPTLGQGEAMLFEFGNRNTGSGTVQTAPTNRLIDRYQLLTTGDFTTPLVLANNANLANGSINPRSYEGRDYRLKATVLWDQQKMLALTTDGMNVLDSITWKFGSKDGVTYINYDNARSGYEFRKWVRQVGGYGREDGPQDMYLLRLPDVWLMYAEAVNEAQGAPTAELFDLLDKIRRRGNLPALNRGKYGSKDEFFKAVEQERIVELVAEGQRFFDIRRWRKAEQVWPAPNGLTLYDTWGARIRDEFKSVPVRDYLRYYIFRIPTGEVQVNSKIVQNEPWL